MSESMKKEAVIVRRSQFGSINVCLGIGEGHSQDIKVIYYKLGSIVNRRRDIIITILDRYY
jgi:hypothetical protein